VGEEMLDGQGWRKAIPEGRDRAQSRWLVLIVGSLVAVMSVSALVLAYSRADRFPAFVFGVIGISVAFAAATWMLRAATPVAAAYGGMICLLLTYWTATFDESIGRSALMPLALLFALTFLSTRAGRQKKAKAGLAEKRRGRSASQVIANLSVAALCVTPLTYVAIERLMPEWRVSGTSNMWIHWTTTVMCLAALVEATADTVSSEIGQAFGGTPVMILNWRRVEPGTDGAVTLIGSGAGIAAGAMVAAVGIWALRLSIAQVAVALGAGVCGLFFDSLLGATVERKGWIGNDLVNFASTVFAALVAAGVYRWITY
jgi:uncharacterized protein (TIGR00297 family)